MKKLTVNLAERSYDIVVTSGDRAGVGAFARQRCRGAGAAGLVVVDENVRTYGTEVTDTLEAEGFRCGKAIIPAGEAQKSLSNASRLYDQLAEMLADRSTLIVAVGGGVVGDLAGFVAATYHRGLPLLMVPTTLLAMVDSSVGGKTGVNHARGKNLIGAFHQPVGVWIDTDTLATLPDREYRSGLAEVVKYGVILDPDLFRYLEEHGAELLKRDPGVLEHMIARCCRLKADVVERDEREVTGLRAALNYGHTFAHAFETVAGYGTWLHGEAVAAGMICASRLAERLGFVGGDVTDRQRTLLARFGLPVQPANWTSDALLAVMRSDKKAVAGRLRFVLPKRLGEVALVDNVAEAEVRQVLERVAGRDHPRPEARS
jgi:3-dehydroquinate synthase